MCVKKKNRENMVMTVMMERKRLACSGKNTHYTSACPQRRSRNSAMRLSNMLFFEFEK